jgi:hypothetical protein
MYVYTHQGAKDERSCFAVYLVHFWAYRHCLARLLSLQSPSCGSRWICRRQHVSSKGKVAQSVGMFECAPWPTWLEALLHIWDLKILCPSGMGRRQHIGQRKNGLACAEIPAGPSQDTLGNIVSCRKVTPGPARTLNVELEFISPKSDS